MIYHWRRLVYTVEQLIAGVVANGGKHKIANISANFHKKSKRPEWEARRLGVNWFMKKAKIENLMSDSHKVDLHPYKQWKQVIFPEGDTLGFVLVTELHFS